MLILPHHHYDGQVTILLDTLFKEAGEWNTIYLIRSADLEQVQLEYSEKTKCSYLSRTAPVIEYRRCRYDGKEDLGVDVYISRKITLLKSGPGLSIATDLLTGLNLYWQV